MAVHHIQRAKSTKQNELPDFNGPYHSTNPKTASATTYKNTARAAAAVLFLGEEKPPSQQSQQPGERPGPTRCRSS